MTNQRVFSEDEVRLIGDTIGIDFDIFNIEEFQMGLAVELEHGSHDPETDVIGNDKNKAGKIAWAHLKEIPDYYTRLKKMESEGEEYWSNKNS